MNLITISIITIGAIGLVCGIALALGARFFQVDEDPRIATVTEMLPGANCGACGFAGCAGYAARLVEDLAAPTLCSPISSENAAKIAAFLGATAPAATVRQVARVLCGGNDAKAKKSFHYSGITDCAAAAAVAGGDKACSYGCLGYGSCARVCPANAISIINGLAVVDPALCIGCRRCVEACPRHLIKMVPEEHQIHVLCSSQDPGAKVRKICSVGCIGCRICTKLADGAITMEGTLAVVNYDLPLTNEAVVEKCPAKTIVKA